jgi:hypothetical protein
MEKNNPDPYCKNTTQLEYVVDNLTHAVKSWKLLSVLLAAALIGSVGLSYFAISKAHVVPFVLNGDDL